VARHDHGRLSAGVRALLQGDAAFTAALSALLGAPLTGVLRSNVPLSALPAGSLPCGIIEQGEGVTESLSQDGADEGHVIGLASQQFGSDLHVAIIWSEADRERAADQRETLPTLFAQLFLRNPQPGGTAFATLTAWEPDFSVNHPLHVWNATVRGSYAIDQ
jgi:hypothetical protein